MFIDKKSLKLAKKILFVLSLSFVFIQVSPDKLVLAQEVEIDYGRGPTDFLLVNHPDNLLEPQEPQIITSTLPTIEELPYYETYITVTAYTSREQETDDSPYIAAWGDHVFWGMIASNAFPRGTKIQIPEYFGDKMFTVLDTMNLRYNWRADVWMDDLDDARHFYHYTKIKVYK